MLPSPDDFTGYDEVYAKHAELQERIVEVQADFNTCLQEIRTERYNSEHAEDGYSWIISHMQEAQLEKLATIVLTLAATSDRTTVIDLDDTGLLDDYDLTLAGTSMNIEASMLEAKDKGETRGTNSFLEIIAPEDVFPIEMRKIYFRPWERQEMERMLIVHQGYVQGHGMASLDGSLAVSLPTRLSNIVVELFYFPGEELPRRLVKVSRDN